MVPLSTCKNNSPTLYICHTSLKTFVLQKNSKEHRLSVGAGNIILKTTNENHAPVSALLFPIGL